MVGQLEVAINGGFCQVDRIPTYVILNYKEIVDMIKNKKKYFITDCLLYTSPSPRD